MFFSYFSFKKGSSNQIYFVIGRRLLRLSGHSLLCRKQHKSLPAQDNKLSTYSKLVKRTAWFEFLHFLSKVSIKKSGSSQRSVTNLRYQIPILCLWLTWFWPDNTTLKCRLFFAHLCMINIQICYCVKSDLFFSSDCGTTILQFFMHDFARIYSPY